MFEDNRGKADHLERWQSIFLSELLFQLWGHPGCSGEPAASVSESLPSAGVCPHLLRALLPSLTHSTRLPLPAWDWHHMWRDLALSTKLHAGFLKMRVPSASPPCIPMVPGTEQLGKLKPSKMGMSKAFVKIYRGIVATWRFLWSMMWNTIIVIISRSTRLSN